MTDLRTAAQQALAEQRLTDMEQKMERSIESLRAALAEPTTEDSSAVEPVQEPVAWRWGYRSVTTGEMDWRGYVEIAAHPNLQSPEIIMEPLYTAPPQRKPPATIDEMFDRMDKAPKGVFFGHDPMTIWMEAWRAAEQHHDIKE